MKKKVFQIFSNSVKNFSKINEIELVATFGSITNFSIPHFDDLDVVTLASPELHEDYLSHLCEQFSRQNLEPLIFKKVIKKPKRTMDNQVLIHDLHYRNLTDLIKSQWPSLLNSLKSTIVVIYGDPNCLNIMPYFEITEKEIFAPIRQWTAEMESKEEFDNFQKYFIKTIPKILDRYGYNNHYVLSGILQIFEKNLFWQEKLKQTVLLVAEIYR